MKTPKMKTPIPPSFTRRRSPLMPRMCELGAVFVPFGVDSSLVETLASQANKIGKASSSQTLALCDLSPLTRIGVKGLGIESLLKRSSVVAPKAVDVNESVVQKDGSLCVRLAQNEVLLLSALDSKGVGDFAPLRKNLEHKNLNVYSVPYQDSLCWLALAGEGASDLLATMCAVDLSDDTFAPGSFGANLARAAFCINSAHASAIVSTASEEPAFVLPSRRQCCEPLPLGLPARRHARNGAWRYCVRKAGLAEVVETRLAQLVAGY